MGAFQEIVPIFAARRRRSARRRRRGKAAAPAGNGLSAARATCSRSSTGRVRHPGAPWRDCRGRSESRSSGSSVMLRVPSGKMISEWPWSRHRQHGVDRVVAWLGPVAVDQDGRQHVLGDEAAQARLAPIVGRRDGAGACRSLCRQAGRQQDEIAMAGMVGEIDALAVRWLAAIPDRRNARDRPRQGRQASGACFAQYLKGSEGRSVMGVKEWQRGSTQV